MRLQGNRCRGRKTKCDGNRPSCTACAGNGHDCHYAADPDTTPITALKRKNEALQEQSVQQRSLVDAFMSVSEADALTLLRRLRGGEEMESLLATSNSMPKVHLLSAPIEPSRQQASSQSPSYPAPESAELHTNDSPLSLGPPTFFEPKIDVTPTPPNLLPPW